MAQLFVFPIAQWISRRFNFTGTSTLLERDLARISQLRAKAAGKLAGRAVVNSPVDNQAVTYVVGTIVNSITGSQI